MKNRSYTLALLLACMLLASFDGLATVYHVKTTGNDTNAGTSWATAFQTLQKALDVVVGGDQIWMAAGTYLPTKESSGTGNRYKTFVMLSGVKIYGGFAGGETSLSQRDWVANVTILSGDIGTPNDNSDNSYHVIYNYDTGLDASAVLDGFTISGGNADEFAPHDRGSGMYNYNSSPTVVNCSISENSSIFFGGGMFNSHSAPVLTNCTFIGNSSKNGGGMHNFYSSPVLTNCSFSGNSGTLGGGMDNLYSSPIVTNCILWGNPGGAIRNFGNLPIVTYSIVQGGSPGTGNLNADPLFVTPPTGGAGGADLRLQTCSPAIDAGDNAAIPMGISTDLDGNPRQFNGGTVDMGAYEFSSSICDCYVSTTRLYVKAGSVGDGKTWGGAFGGLQKALTIAATCSGITEIWVAAGTYLPTKKSGGSSERHRTFSMLPGVKIYGGFAGGETSLSQRNWTTNVTTLSGDIGTPNDDSDNSYHVIYNHNNGLDETAVLDGFTITGGNADGDFFDAKGGGMFNVLAFPTIGNCTFSSNKAEEGGGVFNEFRPTTFKNCIFNENEAVDGGGMYNSKCNPTIENCTFSGNKAIDNEGFSSDGSGGGMFNLTSSPIVTGCDFTGNISNSDIGGGGGMFNFQNSEPNITNCLFSENEAIFGGGLYNSYSSATVENCTFNGNMAEDGAGLRNFNSTASSIVNCTFQGNVAEDNGGGMDNGNSTPTITNCTFIGNEASIGAGMNNLRSSAVLTNCVFLENTADFLGGGVHNFDTPSPSFTNCTFSGNTASSGGGFANSSASPVITNCIIWGNGSEFENNMSTPTVTHSIVQGGYTGTGNLDADPLFVDSDNGDFRLLHCSPGVDAGDNAAIPMGISTDLDGNARIYNSGTVDMGAYELQAPFSYCCPAGNVVFVNKNATGKNTGETWADAFTNLQDALDLIASGDCAMVNEIWVAAGTYLPTKKSGGSSERYRTFVMLPSVKIYGGFAGGETSLGQRDWVANETTLSGNIGDPNTNSDNSYRVVYNNNNGLDATAVLDGFIITGGNANFSTSIVVNSGGGMFNSGSSPTVTNCTFTENSANGEGGGMGNRSCSPVVSNCLFISNTANIKGGGLSNVNSAALVTNCTFLGNTSKDGGGAYNVLNPSSSYVNCTFYGNSASTYGDGMFNLAVDALTISNCIFWDNGSEINTSSSSTVTVTHSIVQGGYPGTGNLDADPLFVTPPTGGAGGADLRLQTCSPAIDAGSNTAIPTGITTDLDGNARTLNATGIPTATVDMGAYEFTGSRTITPVCATPTVQLDANGNGSLTATEVGGGSTANCSPVSLAIDVSSFTCADVGPQSVELTVTEPGLVGEGKCTAIVTIEDNVLPQAKCKPHTVQLDANGNGSLTANNINNGSSDACGISSLSASPNTFNCSNVGANAVTLTVTDNNGNQNTCTATVTVEDNENPVPICKTSTVQLDASGHYALLQNDVFQGGSDNCSIVNYWKISPTAVSCPDVGTPVQVLVEVFDASGNQASCTATINVEDNVAPVANCKEKTIQLGVDGNAALTASDLDDSSADACGIASFLASPNVFDCGNVGANSVTLTVTDINGNPATCSTTVSVEDNVLPMAICKSHTVALDAAGNASITVADVNDDSSDACGIASTNLSQSVFACTNTGVNIVVLTVEDNNGNAATCNAMVTVVDNVLPSANCTAQPIQATLSANAQYTVDPNSLNNGSTDACGIQSLSASPALLDCQDEGTNTVTLIVTDVNGNTSSCTATVVVAPFITGTSAVSTAESCAGAGNGTVTASATAIGGQMKYSIDGVNFQSSGQFNNLTPGSYTVTFKVYGIPAVCEKTAMVTIGAGGSPTTWYKDIDNDGWSDGVSQYGCVRPANYKTSAELDGHISGDCNDNNPLLFPGQTWYKDGDGDGYSNGATQTGCNRPSGYKAASELVQTSGDCNDGNVAIHPGATEICNGIDDNCNGEVDEGTSGGLTYVGNLQFTTQAAVDAFSQCYSVIDGNVTISGAGINDLSNLENLTEVTGNITIQYTGLVDMDGLDNLVEVGGTLTIFFNSSLTTLNGLGSLAAVGGSLMMYYNFQLSDCCAIYGLLDNGGVAGNVVINMNKVGCNSAAQVISNCQPNSSLIGAGNGGSNTPQVCSDCMHKAILRVYPNPASATVQVRWENDNPSGTVQLTDMTGRVLVQIALKNSNEISLGHISPGSYLVRVRADGYKQYVERLVIGR